LLSAACQSTPVSVPVPVSTPTQTPTQTPTPTPTPTPTQTPVPNTPTPTKKPIPYYQENCLEIETTLPDGFLAEGVIIYNSTGENGSNELSSFSTAEKKNRILLSNLQWYSYFSWVDPTGKWILHNIYDEDGDIYEVLDVNGQLIRSFSDPTHTWNGSPHYWINQQQLFLDSQINPGSNYFAVDVFTSQAIELGESHLGFTKNPGTIPYYDPSLTRVVVQRVLEDNPFLIRLGLWDTKNRRVLWETEDTFNYYYLQQPNWKLDGSGFVIGFSPGIRAEIDQLIIVDRNGVAEQVTEFSEYGLQIFNPKWSPDGRYIAYWYGNSATVYDSTTGISTNYCISDYSITEWPVFNTDFYWSPDSRQVIFDFYDGPVVLDVQQQRAIQLPFLGSIEGWMESGE